MNPALVSGLAMAISGGVSPALAKSIAYYSFPSGGFGYLMDWKAEQRVRVTTSSGVVPGQYADNGTQKLITLDTPFSTDVGGGSDNCGSFVNRRLIHQIVVRDLPAKVSQVVDIGEDVVVGGCRDGESTPFGSPDDAGWSTTRLAMTARPPMTDLVAGVKIAGPSDADWPANTYYPPQGTVSIQAGTVTFQGSGQTVGASFSSDGWWVFNLPGGQRAQTRLYVDSKTGGEAWLLADWKNGKPVRVTGLNFVKTSADAGFGTVAEASRMWQLGYTVGSNDTFFHYLYRNGTGERVTKIVDTGEEFRSPITSWGLDGADLWEQRVSAGVYFYNRRWAPLRNQGTKTRWVMENYEFVDDSGITTPIIKPRVINYVDTGKAVPPAP
jgi:hypothetical protein